MPREVTRSLLLAPVDKTAWRIKSEVLPITWDRVDLEEGTVRLWTGTSKNGEGRVIALPSELKAILGRLWAEHLSLWSKCAYVSHRAGRRIKSYRNAFESACEEAGLGDKVPLDFRRTGARNMVRPAFLSAWR